MIVNEHDDNGNELSLILTIMLLIAMGLTLILQVIVIIKKWPTKNKKLLVTHGSASITVLSFVMLLVATVALILQVTETGIALHKKHEHDHVRSSILTLQQIPNFVLFAMELMFLVFATQKLVEKYADASRVHHQPQTKRGTLLYSVWHLFLFVVSVVVTFGVAVMMITIRWRSEHNKSSGKTEQLASAIVQTVYFSVFATVFLYCLSLVAILLSTVRSKLSDLDEIESVNIVSGLIIVSALLCTANFVIQAVNAGLRNRVGGLVDAAFYVDKVAVLIIAAICVLVLGYWNPELGKEPDSEGLHFSHSRATLYNTLE